MQGALREHARMNIAARAVLRTGSPGRHPRSGNRFDRGQQAAGVVPVSMRQHDRLYRAQIGAEDVRIAQKGCPLGTCVEQQRMRLCTDLRADQERQAMVRAADVRPRHHAHAAAGEQPGPLGSHVRGIGGQAVGQVVDQHQHLETVNGQHVGHGIVSAPLIVVRVTSDTGESA